MNFHKKFNQKKQIEYPCDLCGTPTAQIRTITRNNVIDNALSGFTCQDCLDAEEDYVEKLEDELNNNPKLRDQRAEQFQRIRLGEKADFICKYGPGVKHINCKICGQGFSYQIVVEDHFPDHIIIRDEISNFFCSDCIVNGSMQTHVTESLLKLLQFRKASEDVKKKYEFFKSLSESQFINEKKNFISTFEHGKELEAEEAIVTILNNATFYV
jgi:hypothetical protein